MANFAHIENGIVTNLILWDGDNETWTPPEGMQLVEAPSGVAIGYRYEGSAFKPPAMPTVTLTVDQRIAALKAAIAAYLDAGAQVRGYDNIINAALRAGFDGPYQAEGIALAQWMDTCWQKGYALLAQWQAGELAEPTPAQLVAMLPKQPLP